MPDLPMYQCHKKVWALKITNVFPVSDGGVMLGFDDPHLPTKKDAEWVERHGPQAGGYWVKYADGYESWSPAKAFEEGYSRIK